MKSLVQWTVIAISSARVALAALPERFQHGSGLPFVPNRYIIEIDDLARLSSKRSFERSLDAVYDSLNERGVGLEIDREFEGTSFFTGAAITLRDANDVATIEDTPGIKSIRPVIKVQPPNPQFSKRVTSRDDPVVPKDPFSTHVMTGVDKLHAEGLSGKGIKIGILDTGIDYTHPALGNGYGPGKKVFGGYDFVGDAYTGRNDPIADDDPLDQCNGHGTHVAGIIVADPGNPFDIVGVAPNATISAYRIFGCTGFVEDDIIVDALLRGVRDGNDILTLSLGGADGWTSSAAAVVASRIARSGKIVTIAAGNDGSDGAWYASSPGSAIDAISVASVDNIVLPLQKVVLGGVEKDPGIIYYSTYPLPIPTLPIYVLSNDTTNPTDACEPLPDDTPDLSKFLVIIRRGTCPFVQKLTNAEAKGAKFALIYDNGNGFQGIDVGRFAGTASLIRAADGLFLVEQWKAGVPVTVTFPQSGGSVGYPVPRGGLVSSFSSYGPTNDFYFKPAVAAPGGGILSTIPDSGYAVLSGTSMATPLVAGASALLFEAKGKTAQVARGARTLFESTAKYIPSNLTDGDPLQTVTQQGAGLINVYDALHATTILSKGELILNDTVSFKPVHTFRVTNTGSASKDYTLSHIIAGTALTFIPNSEFTAYGPVPLAKAGAIAKITPEKFTLSSGQSREVTVHFTPPAGLDPTTFPVFSGFIEVSAPSDAIPVHVSYIGGIGSLRSLKIIDTSQKVIPDKIPAIFNATAEVQEVPTNYTFGPLDYPTVFWRQVFGSPIVRVDLVDQDIKIVTNVINRREPALGLPYFTLPLDAMRGGKGGGGGGTGSFGQVKIVGTLKEFPFLSRNDDDLGGNGFHSVDMEEPLFANGTTIPNGMYRVLLRALKVTGDWKKQEDYETWLSPILGVQVPESPPPEEPEPEPEAPEEPVEPQEPTP